MANRKNPNTNFGWYIEGDMIAILYKNASTGAYESWRSSTVEDAVRVSYTAKYDAVQYYDNNLKDNNRVDSGLHAALLNYVKSRLEEDMGNYDKSAYFHQKYRNKIRTYPHRKKGQRGIKVPNL